MQLPRRLLLISLATLLVTIMVLSPLANKVYSAQHGVSQQITAVESLSSQSTYREGSQSGLDRERFADIRKVLSMVETGRTALHLIDKFDIGIGFDRGEGTRFYPYRNEIIIDSKYGQFSAAIYLIHEITHARYFHEGLAADVKQTPRQAYVQMKLAEEISAMVASIEATTELWEAGVDISNLHPSLYFPYKQAYASAVRAARFDDPGLDELALQNIGRVAGHRAVTEAVTTGQVVTSITQQSYEGYWGSVWDVQRGV